MCDLHISYWFYFTRIIILHTCTNRKDCDKTFYLCPLPAAMKSVCLPLIFLSFSGYWTNGLLCAGESHTILSSFADDFFHAVLVNDFDISSTIWYILCKADLILLKQPKLLLTEMIQLNKKYLNWNNLPMNEKNENCRLPLSS